MIAEQSPFHTPVSACEASDAGVVNTRASIDPSGVAQHQAWAANLTNYFISYKLPCLLT